MPRQPRIPNLPEQLPQQRLYLVKGLPLRPAGWSCLSGDAVAAIAPASMPRSAHYIGQVEWAWSPMHMRIDAYYLSMDSGHRHWVLWVKGYDDNWGRWMTPDACVAAPRAGLGPDAAARLLLCDYWQTQREEDLDRFHWINEDELLNAGDLSNVATAVWGDESPDDQEDPSDDDDAVDQDGH